MSNINKSIFIWTNCGTIHHIFSNHNYRNYFKSIENKIFVTVLDNYEGISGLHLSLYLKNIASCNLEKNGNSN